MTYEFMRGGISRISTDRYGRWYKWRGDKFFSVTTILGGGVPKPALINWAKKFTAEYAVDNFDKLGVLLEPDTDGNVDRKGAVDWLKGAAFRDRDTKADLGTTVHDYAEAWVLGKPLPEWPPEIDGYMAAFERFLTDFAPAFDAVEAPVFSRAQRYAGTLDAIATFDRKLFDEEALRIFRGVGVVSTEDPLGDPLRLLVDYKTGKGVYPEVALQLAAYRYADVFLGLPDTSEAPMPPLDGAIVLHLRPDGTYGVIPVLCDDEIFQLFLYVREVFRFQRDVSKTVLGEPVEPNREDR